VICSVNGDESAKVRYIILEMEDVVSRNRKVLCGVSFSHKHDLLLCFSIP
jgi:hypothetical protein